jgi:hypothetical protein
VDCDTTRNIALHAILQGARLAASRGISYILEATSELVPEEKMILKRMIEVAIVAKIEHVGELLVSHFTIFNVRIGLINF